MKLLSTGQAAQRCAVTRETIGKWIRAGKLPVRKTAGGHYRVPEESLRPFLRDLQPEGPSDEPSQPAYCWQFFARRGRVSRKCQACIVYRSRATHCFELSKLPVGVGFSGTHCKTGCNDCPYFQTRWASPLRVLVITDDPEFQAALEDGAKGSQLEMRFTGCAYECSTLVATFSPDCVLLDGSMPRAKREQLRADLARDPRVSSTKIILATIRPRPARMAQERGDLEIIKPFSAAQLRSCLQDLEIASVST